MNKTSLSQYKHTVDIYLVLAKFLLLIDNTDHGRAGNYV